MPISGHPAFPQEPLDPLLRSRVAAAEAWLAENAEAIRAYNDDVAAHGVFSDGLRNF